MKRDKKSLSIGILIATALGLLLAFAGSDKGVAVSGMAVFMLCCVFAYALNWIVFIPANIAQTERYYDLTGSLTYIGMILIAVCLSGPLDERATIVAIMVGVWAVRLGSFLYIRIKQDGGDTRFDEIKTNPVRFFLAWTIQALWTIMTAACALAIITSNNKTPLDILGQIGIVVWIVGFLLEVIADSQKRAFKKDPAHAGRFITNGLWSWSQHPNYFGEIMLWTGIAIMAVPILEGLQWATLVSPLFVILLLTRLSGIPLLQAKANKRWGDDPQYQEYRNKTSLLIPLPPKQNE